MSWRRCKSLAGGLGYEDGGTTLVHFQQLDRVYAAKLLLDAGRGAINKRKCHRRQVLRCLVFVVSWEGLRCVVRTGEYNGGSKRGSMTRFHRGQINNTCCMTWAGTPPIGTPPYPRFDFRVLIFCISIELMNTAYVPSFVKVLHRRHLSGARAPRHLAEDRRPNGKVKGAIS